MIHARRAAYGRLFFIKLPGAKTQKDNINYEMYDFA